MSRRKYYHIKGARTHKVYGKTYTRTGARKLLRDLATAQAVPKNALYILAPDDQRIYVKG